MERVEEQCLPLNGLTYGQVIFALNQTLQQHEDIRHGRVKPSYTTDDLINNYQCGNINSVVFNQDTAQVSLLSTRSKLNMAEQQLAQEIDTYFKNHLIYERNRRMGGRVVGMTIKLFFNINLALFRTVTQQPRIIILLCFRSRSLCWQ